ncbi:hypothetical protein [Brevibacillus brevis]|uniref:Uncharacterized protein n=1 Tax=Brevibacillus brevis TaxID=1393 RepID=A0A517I806_BREBE|nr:hypothetical protein [Brevibacillus brevis]QDS35024.1 hypothetical protein FPS98_14020 [Brevibacillus brevis]
MKIGQLSRNEMTDDDHCDLLKVLNDHPGPVLLSGYANDVYIDMLSNCQCEERQQVIETGQVRTEVLWINPVAANHGSRQS